MTINYDKLNKSIVNNPQPTQTTEFNHYPFGDLGIYLADTNKVEFKIDIWTFTLKGIPEDFKIYATRTYPIAGEVTKLVCEVVYDDLYSVDDGLASMFYKYISS